MREYLFRGKRKDNQQWVEGSLTIEYDRTCHINRWISKLTEPANNFYEQVHEMYEVIPETVGMYIRMQDSKEQNIFDGDIVKCYDNWGFDKIHIGIIEDTPPCYSLKIPGKITVDTPALKCRDNDIYLDDWCNAENIEIIGNVHDNPELLQSL